MLLDLQTLAHQIREIARAEILPRFEQVGFEIKADGSLLTEADLAVNQRVKDYLAQHYPAIPFLSEEMTSSEQREVLKAPTCWCLDPLDGTSNFVAGIPLFATSLALIHQQTVQLAITYDPIRDELFTAQLGQGAWLNNRRLSSQVSRVPLDKSVALIDFKRLSRSLQGAILEAVPYGSQRNLGSCALEWAWMAASRGQIYLHGGMKLWDLAAGTLLLAEAGGRSCTLKGDSVFQTVLEPRSVVAAPDPHLFTQWYSFLHEHSH